MGISFPLKTLIKIVSGGVRGQSRQKKQLEYCSDNKKGLCCFACSLEILAFRANLGEAVVG
jgi:hypothetical protein